MKKILTIFYLLTSITVPGQDPNLLVLHNTVKVGINLMDSTEIKGTEFRFFPERVHKTHFDTISGLITVQLRGFTTDKKWLNPTGHIIQYDYINKQKLWNKPINYQIGNLRQFGNFMIYSIEGKSICWNVHKGIYRWDVRNDIYYVDQAEKIGLGYRIRGSKPNTDELQGIDMNNGDILWDRRIFKAFGWNELFYQNDSIVIIVAGGIHSLNIHNGEGWDYHAMTGVYDSKGKNAAKLLGFAGGLLTGTYFTSTGYNVISHLVSNALVDRSHIYLASNEELVKLSSQSGEVVWTFPFPENFGSKSSIFKNDSVLYMVNQGIAYMRYRKLNFGKPFFAAFDVHTGSPKFLSLIDVEDDPILSCEIKNDEIFLLFKHRIAKYSMVSGALLNENEIDQNSYGELIDFIGNQVYSTSMDGKFENLNLPDTTLVYIFTNQQKTLAIDFDLNIKETIPYENLRIQYLITDQFKFFSKGKNTVVLNHDGEKVAEIDVSSDAKLIGNSLYDRRENFLIQVDLEELSK